MHLPLVIGLTGASLALKSSGIAQPMKSLPLLFSRRLVLCLAASLGASQASRAAPDFSKSEIVATHETVLEGDVARFKVVVRNQGDAPADPLELRIEWPMMGHLINVTGLDNAQTDYDGGVVTATFPLPVGAEHTAMVDVLAPRDSGGTSLSMTARIIHYHTMAEAWIHQTIPIEIRPRTDGIQLGGFRIAPAGIATLAWLAVTALGVFSVRRVDTGHSKRLIGAPVGVFSLMIAIGFWMIFAAMAWRDYQVLFHWSETTATIVGRRIQTDTVSSSHRLSSGATTQSRTSEISKPEFALRYQVAGREWLSTGYDTGSSLRVGGGKAQLEREFREWTIGATVPCWHDPNDPSDVVIKRGFGGAYLFALFPLFPFWIGWFTLRRHFASAA
ncbi:MAG: DUF3592 domain-containing protein [Verrucomicrobiaceae bacterium]|nr:DUF3592 domain-containing protein [Verrucomicrobiaceae bacterium]